MTTEFSYIVFGSCFEYGYFLLNTGNHIPEECGETGHLRIDTEDTWENDNKDP